MLDDNDNVDDDDHDMMMILYIVKQLLQTTTDGIFNRCHWFQYSFVWKWKQHLQYNHLQDKFIERSRFTCKMPVLLF